MIWTVPQKSCIGHKAELVEQKKREKEKFSPNFDGKCGKSQSDDWKWTVDLHSRKWWCSTERQNATYSIFKEVTPIICQSSISTNFTLIELTKTPNFKSFCNFEQFGSGTGLTAGFGTGFPSIGIPLHFPFFHELKDMLVLGFHAIYLLFNIQTHKIRVGILK